jgi:hypothetical protein
MKVENGAQNPRHRGEYSAAGTGVGKEVFAVALAAGTATASERTREELQ